MLSMDHTHSLRKKDNWTAVVLLIIVFLCLCAIVFATLSPFKFEFSSKVNQLSIVSTFSLSTAIYDFLRNILLFVPFSFASSLFIAHQIDLNRRKYWIILVASFVLSLTIEGLQLYLPQRTPTILDLIANSIGGFSGLIMFEVIGSQVLKIISFFTKESRRLLSYKNNIKFLVIAYVSFSIAILSYLNSQTLLNNWNSQYPLVVGNEFTGDRAWNGYIEELYILNQELGSDKVEEFFRSNNKTSVVSDSLLVALDFRDSIDYKYAIPETPEMKWFEKASKDPTDKSRGISVDSNNWLSTQSAVRSLINSVIKSSQLSIAVNISTADLNQDGPARIVSISDTPASRNITLGQDEKDLMVRIRTPFTQKNGSRPSVIFPDVFVDSDQHYLIYTYDGRVSKLYVDNEESVQSVTFNPASMIFWSLNELPFFPKFTPNFIYPESTFLYYLNILFYVFLATPIVFFLYCYCIASF